MEEVVQPEGLPFCMMDIFLSESPHSRKTSRVSSENFYSNLPNHGMPELPRPFTTPAPMSHYHQPSVIALSGNGIPPFLQGLVTVIESGILRRVSERTGRMLHDVFFYPASRQGGKEAILFMRVVAKEAENLAAHLRRFKLRAKVTGASAGR